jgi:hypothetical protein
MKNERARYNDERRAPIRLGLIAKSMAVKEPGIVATSE